MTDSLEQRVQRLEDRNQIVETVVQFFMSLDRNDWDLFKRMIADPIRIDFSSWKPEMPPREVAREELAAFASARLTKFDKLQHMNPNHVVTFDSDSEATCTSYMYAQHVMDDARGGTYFLMVGSYTSVLQRKPEGGWEMSQLTMHFDWGYGNDQLFPLSLARYTEEAAAH